MSVSLCISFGIISPFYPSEAAKKGASTTEVGLVFGVFQLVMFITSPFYGAYVSVSPVLMIALKFPNILFENMYLSKLLTGFQILFYDENLVEWK